jgi:hypothetical protein
MTKFEWVPREPVQAVQWKLDNMGDIQEFLGSLPDLVEPGFSGAHVDQETLTLIGYRCINGEVLYVSKDHWIIFTFSDMHDDFRLTTLSDELFNEYFARPEAEEPCNYSEDRSGY